MQSAIGTAFDTNRLEGIRLVKKLVDRCTWIWCPEGPGTPPRLSVRKSSQRRLVSRGSCLPKDFATSTPEASSDSDELAQEVPGQRKMGLTNEAIVSVTLPCRKAMIALVDRGSKKYHEWVTQIRGAQSSLSGPLRDWVSVRKWCRSPIESAGQPFFRQSDASNRINSSRRAPRQESACQGHRNHMPSHRNHRYFSSIWGLRGFPKAGPKCTMGKSCSEPCLGEYT